VTKTENNMANDIANAFSTQLETKFDNDAMAKLEANAKAQAEGGFLPLGSTTSDSNVSNTYNVNISNKISKTMKDMITNEIQRNFSTKSLKERLSTLQQQQKTKLVIGSIEDSENLDLGNASQNQDAELLMKAVSEDTTINKTIDKITNQLNSISVDDVTSKASGDLKGTATSEAKQKGLDSIVDSIMGFFSGLFKGYFAVIIVIVVVICIIGVVFFMTGGQETLQQGLSKIGGGYVSKSEYSALVRVFENIKNNN
jgi:transcriptional regulator NrdR family protein